MDSVAHLAKRFVTSLWPGGPAADATAWAHRHLLPSEAGLWDRMSGPDRRHSVAVARRLVADLGEDTERPVVAAALLHDIGKTDARLGTFGRVLATLAAAVFGRSRVSSWAGRRGFAGRWGRYVRHTERGEAMLTAAGSHQVTAWWAGDHHRDPGTWRVPRWVGDALKAADDD